MYIYGLGSIDIALLYCVHCFEFSYILGVNIKYVLNGQYCLRLQKLLKLECVGLVVYYLKPLFMYILHSFLGFIYFGDFMLSNAG